jgi:hypothetical protein
MNESTTTIYHDSDDYHEEYNVDQSIKKGSSPIRKGSSSQIVYVGGDIDFTLDYETHTHLFLSRCDDESLGRTETISQRIKMKPSFGQSLAF